MEIRDAAQFVSYLDNIRGRTERVVACVPPDRLEWSPAEGAFSFGDVIRHLAATERYMFAENVQGRQSRYPGHGKDLADGYDAVLAFWRRMHLEAVTIFAGLSAERLAGRCITPGGADMPVWKWLRAMVEHEVHHRGQLYLMLRLLGIAPPPLYGLTSEEVRRRSAAPG